MEQWNNGTCEKITELLVEAENNPNAHKWQAVVTQYHGRHLIAQNEIEKAQTYFSHALDECEQRNYGPLRGEIAVNGFACLLANKKLAPNNDEKYYRYLMEYPVIELRKGEEPNLETFAHHAREHFWSALYKPYPSVKPLTRSE